MKYLKVILLSLLWIGSTLADCGCQGIKDPTIRRANSTILSSFFTINTATNSATQKNMTVPVTNFYRRLPGCYLACYSKTGNKLEGLLRINGLYIGSTCQAQGFFFRDMATLTNFQKLCNTQIAQCGNNCVPNGETGQWLGIHVGEKVA